MVRPSRRLQCIFELGSCRPLPQRQDSEAGDSGRPGGCEYSSDEMRVLCRVSSVKIGVFSTLAGDMALEALGRVAASEDGNQKEAVEGAKMHARTSFPRRRASHHQ